jgi:hypothetical protein
MHTLKISAHSLPVVYCCLAIPFGNFLIPVNLGIVANHLSN